MAKQPRSPAQIAHVEKLKAMHAAKNVAREAAGATAVIDRPDGEDDVFAQLAAALSDVGKGREARNAKLAEVDRVLGSLDPREYPGLHDNPVVQKFIEVMTERVAELHPDDPPGTIYDRGQPNEKKKPWQWRDVWKAFPAPGGGEGDIETVEVTPNETMPLTWNGLKIVIVADTQQWIPRPHYEVYQEVRRGRETARQHAAMMFHQRDRITGIADPSVASENTGRVRGRGMGKEGYRPGAGGFNPYTEGAEAEGETT